MSAAPRGAGARPAHAHALRRGLRHLALRRGVALGGGGRRLPAAARGARRRAGHRRADAGALRPARGAARRGRRALPALPARGPRAESTRRTRAGLARTDEPELAAEVRRAAGDYARRGGRVRAPRPRPARRVRARSTRRGAVDLGRHPRRAAAARHRRGAAAPGRHRRSPRTRAASATGAAASGCPSAPTRRASSASWPSRGVRAFCVDQTDVLGLGALDHLEPVATAGGPGRRADRLADGRARLGRRDGYPAHAAYRDYHRRTRARPAPWNNGGDALRPRRPPRPGPRAHARDFVAASRARRLPAGRRPGCRAARSTPSCSATGGTRARTGWRAVLERGAARQGLDAGDAVARRSSACRAGGARRWRRRPGAAGKDLSTWDSPAGGGLAFAARARRAAHRGRRAPARAARARRSSAPRASCSRCSRATGPSWSRATWRATIPAPRARRTRRTHWTPRWPL